MNWELIHTILDKLDSAANSNSFWIALGLPRGTFELSEVLLRHLRTGSFHYELVKQDINRGWNHYSELILPQESIQPSLIQRPGNCWNGNEIIGYEEISKSLLSDRLTDMLTGGT